MLEVFILSIIQGITEFLPVSSSSHLIIISEFFKFDNQLDYSISKPIFKILNKNSIFKKFSNLFSEKGLSI